ncbi:MAG TPA: universal stress protein [Usitatibacter sp.]|nr:universal stress protein [Usitatibacter sp.]
MYHHILIASDGSEASERAVREGIQLAVDHKARVTLLTASPPLHAIGGDAAQPDDAYRKATGAVAEERLRPWADYARNHGLQAEMSHVFVAEPAEAIVRAARARHCDLVVMGTRGYTGLKRALLGSHAGDVIAMSEVPVLVCR